MKILGTAALLWAAAVAAASADVPVIECPAEPPAVRRLQLQEMWRIDPSDPDAPLLGITDPGKIVAHDGRLFLLDGQLCEALVYSDDGEFLGTVYRQGQGPGEIHDPHRMFLCSDGRLAVHYGYPTQLEFIDPDGTPRGRWRLGYNAWAMYVHETPAGWLGSYHQSMQNGQPGVFESVYHVALHDDEGERTRDLFTRKHESRHGETGATDEAEEYTGWGRVAITTTGEIVHAPARDEYRIEWRNLEGETVRIATRPCAAHERTREEMDRLKYSSYSVSNGDVQFKKKNLCAADPMIGSIDPLPDGAIRVRTSRFEKDLPEGMVCRYEVHGPDGRLRERVEIYDPTGDYDTDYDTIALLDDGRAIVLRNQRPASRAALDARMLPEVLAKMPPPPDDREDIALTPIVCRLVPYPEGSR